MIKFIKTVIVELIKLLWSISKIGKKPANKKTDDLVIDNQAVEIIKETKVIEEVQKIVTSSDTAQEQINKLIEMEKDPEIKSILEKLSKI